MVRMSEKSKQIRSEKAARKNAREKHRILGLKAAAWTKKKSDSIAEVDFFLKTFNTFFSRISPQLPVK